MKLARPERRMHGETIIALIDVVFFLLVFFMLIGRLDATAPFEVLPPLATTGSDLPAGGVTVSVAADGTLALDGAPVARADLADGLAKLLAQKPDTLVRINAHRDAELRHVLPILSLTETAGAAETALIVTARPVPGAP
ncbi:MAG: ExbD/TolR family protein [Marinibacterium sp.]